MSDLPTMLVGMPTIYTPAPLVYTVKQAADALQISVTGMYRLIAAGEIQTVDVSTYGRAKTRVTVAALEAFIDSRTSNRPTRRADR